MSQWTTRPELRGTFGMVSSTHWLASAAGLAVLERGGNAFDAAVATGFALQVVAPHLNGPGGEVPILFQRSEAPGEIQVICGQGPVPRAATIERFQELGLDLIPGTGLLAACVPGAFDAWMVLLRDHGTLGLGDVLEYAIGYADHGHPAVPGVARAIGAVEELFRQEWLGSAALYLPVPAPGARLRNRELAATYRRLVTEAEASASGREQQIEAARDLFYRGFIAEAIDEFLASAEALDSSGRRHRGLLRADDLGEWQATVETPLSRRYRDWTIHKTDAWAQGPVFLQQLALLEGFEIAAMKRDGPDFIHTVVECAKLAFADREAWYGDPAQTGPAVSPLLDAGYAEERRRLVGEEASFELRPGKLEGGEPRLPALGGRALMGPAGAGEPRRVFGGAQPPRGDTCHLDVTDAGGNLVAATPSGGWLHGSPSIPGLGFPLGTRAQMCWLESGLPASLAPGVRPRTTLTPTIGLRDDGYALAFGTPGGDQQDQWSLIFFLTHVDHGYGLQAAIDAPQFHTSHFPSSFYPREAEPGHIELESRMPRQTVTELRRRGHQVALAASWSLGMVCAVGREPGSLLRAAADSRVGHCYAMGR